MCALSAADNATCLRRKGRRGPVAPARCGRATARVRGAGRRGATRRSARAAAGLKAGAAAAAAVKAGGAARPAPRPRRRGGNFAANGWHRGISKQHGNLGKKAKVSGGGKGKGSKGKKTSRCKSPEITIPFPIARPRGYFARRYRAIHNVTRCERAEKRVTTETSGIEVT